LGGARERGVEGSAAAWRARDCAELNTIALECALALGARASSRLAGLPDDAFEHDGQLTKREIRAVTLARLAPLPGEALWDIGAGRAEPLGARHVWRPLLPVTQLVAAKPG